MLARLWKTLRHEPLAHFVLLAGALFLANALWSADRPEPIVVDDATVAFLVAQQEELAGRALTREERRAVIEAYIDDEVLVREAYRRGLDQDAVVRRHLAQKMRFVLAEDRPEPSDADLRAFLAAHAERYREPPTVTLDHVFYADPAAVPDDLLERLGAGVAIEGLGDRLYSLDHRLERYSERELLGLLGAELARRIVALPEGEWHGPLASRDGAHFVRVAARHPAATPPFEQLEPRLREDWALTRQGEIVAEALRELRGQYDIVLEAPAP